MLLDWTLTGLDIFWWILDGLDRCCSTIGWIGLILVNPIGSNYLKGLAGTWLKYIATVGASSDASAFVSSSLLLWLLKTQESHISATYSPMASINSYFGGVHSNSSDKITLCPANPTFSESTCLDSFRIPRQRICAQVGVRNSTPSERTTLADLAIWENLVRMTDGADV
jgi:hypothetical protein